MGLCCGKQTDVVDPTERTRLLKDKAQGGPRKSSANAAGGLYKEAQALDEESALQAILDTTANDLIDVNRVTAGVQLCKRDYVERENQYKMTINQHVSTPQQATTTTLGAPPLPVSAVGGSDADSLINILQAPSQSTSCRQWLQDKNVGVVESIQGMAVQAKGNFVVTLEPLS